MMTFGVTSNRAVLKQIIGAITATRFRGTIELEHDLYRLARLSLVPTKLYNVGLMVSCNNIFALCHLERRAKPRAMPKGPKSG